MTQTFNQDVFIGGSTDATQLRVQGTPGQTQPLETWEDNTSTALARLTNGGKFQIGDLGLSTPAALLEASADLTPSSGKPNRGLHALGRFTGALTSALTWAVHELELLGTGGITSLQTALRSKITNNNTGTITNAEMRAGDFQALNQQGGSSNAIKQITGVHASADTAVNAHTAKAVAVEAAITNDTGAAVTDASGFEMATPVNNGTITNLYGLRIPDLTQGVNNIAIQTGLGPVRVGDHEELKVLAATPTSNPPAGYAKVYIRIAGSTPTLFSKDSSGVERPLGGGASETAAPLHLVGLDDVVQLIVQAAPDQGQDLQQWQTNDGTIVSRFTASGSFKVWGQTDDVRLFAKVSDTQTNDLLRIERTDGDAIAQILPSGSLKVWGQTNDVRLFAKATADQTQDLLRLEKSDGSAIGQIPASGSFKVWGQSDDVRLFAKATADQTQDLLRLEKSDGSAIAQIPASGSLKVWGQSDDVRLFAKATADQTQDLLRLEKSDGSAIAQILPSGSLRLWGQSNDVKLVVQAASDQTLGTPLQTWQLSDGSVIAALYPDGSYFAKAIGLNSGLLKFQTNEGDPLANLDSNGNFALFGQTNDVRVIIKGAPVQTQDFLRLIANDNTFVAQLSASGGLKIWGQTDDVRLFAKASATQTNELLRLEGNDGTVVHSVAGSGATVIRGQANNVQLLVKGNATQTQDLQQWQDNSGAIKASIDNAGKLTVTNFQLTSGAGANKILKSDASGNASWQTGGTGTVTSVGLSAPSIFSVSGSPVTASGTLALSLSTQSANQVFCGPTSGGAATPTFRTLTAADLASALASPPAIGGTTPAAGTFSVVTGLTTDAGTTTIVDVGILGHNSSGTPAAGFGTGLLFRAKSSTTADQSQGHIRTEWVTATHASRAAKMTFSVFDASAERTGFAIDTSGSAARIGFFGVTPAVRQTGGAATAGASYTANEQSMINKMYTALQAYGLLT